ncbi:RND transporter [Dyadobacter frigoris]|uniref:efflux RND transporter periplasmic adaptor subunit n=1 Tax=Dyadobacter frigoris TaxID=2576211 RepID=UPI0024A22003|nr:efflux RND transporter periplasmic adaptor subunit [Dyadobacter frigoris]GLU55233.1 RND transporter [Dyadobacter frigoris]
MKPNQLFFLALLFGCADNKTSQPVIAISLPVVKIASGSAITYQDFPASIEGKANVEIRSQVNGTLDHLFVDEGDYVTAGAPLFKINARPYQERLNNATANLHATEGALANAQLEVEKLTPLVKNKVLSDYQLKTALASQRIAQANIEQAQAQIASALIDLGYTIIKAPVSGYIGRLAKKQGSLISTTDAEAITDLSDVHEVHVYFSFGETDFINFKSQYQGKTLTEKLKQLPDVELILSDDNSYALKGRVDKINGLFDKNTGAISVRATFPNNDGLLRSGNTGKLRLGLLHNSIVRVPQSATQETQDKVFVYTVDNSNKVKKQLITIAGTSGKDYLVKDGIKAGDLIVFNGFDRLHEGETITPTIIKDPNNSDLIINN